MGGLGTYVTCQISEFLFFFFFFSFFFFLSSPRAQVAFLDRSRRSIRQNACFRPHSGGQTPKKSPKIGPNRHFTAKSMKRQDKMAIYLSPMKIFVSILTDRLNTRGINKKCKNRSIGVVRESRDPILELWDPLVSVSYTHLTLPTIYSV